MNVAFYQSNLPSDSIVLIGIGDQVSFHHVDLIGATGAALGTLRFGFRIQLQIHAAISKYKASCAVKPRPVVEVGKW